MSVRFQPVAQSSLSLSQVIVFPETVECQPYSLPSSLPFMVSPSTVISFGFVPLAEFGHPAKPITAKKIATHLIIFFILILL